MGSFARQLQLALPVLVIRFAAVSSITLLSHQGVDEVELPDNSRRENEWVNIAQAHRAADVIDCEYKRKPGADNRIEILNRIRVEIRFCPKAAYPVGGRRDLHAEISRH